MTNPEPPCRYCGHALTTHNGPYCMALPVIHEDMKTPACQPNQKRTECTRCFTPWPCSLVSLSRKFWGLS